MGNILRAGSFLLSAEALVYGLVPMVIGLFRVFPQNQWMVVWDGPSIDVVCMETPSQFTSHRFTLQMESRLSFIVVYMYFCEGAYTKSFFLTAFSFGLPLAMATHRVYKVS
jgi:hypothetical protein